ncbi:uncharacterized protein LOC113945379 [Corapipo altera]|uniref:uncharacterized protein LOC113945379 n=1 Tax=Corapipo altera TaxID=415028 RepID=UPI000FD6595D|nr:uncharacterized protein LOC113945379 [Corapipo altera]
MLLRGWETGRREEGPGHRQPTSGGEFLRGSWSGGCSPWLSPGPGWVLDADGRRAGSTPPHSCRAAAVGAAPRSPPPAGGGEAVRGGGGGVGPERGRWRGGGPGPSPCGEKGRLPPATSGGACRGRRQGALTALLVRFAQLSRLRCWKVVFFTVGREWRREINILARQFRSAPRTTIMKQPRNRRGHPLRRNDEGNFHHVEFSIFTGAQ